MNFALFLRTRWLSVVLLFCTILAVATVAQDVTGRVWRKKLVLSSSQFHTSAPNVFLATFENQEFEMPRRLTAAIEVFEKDVQLRRTSIKKINSGPPGSYALSRKKVWVLPNSGKPVDLVAKIPLLVPRWLRAFVYSGLALALLSEIVPLRTTAAFVYGGLALASRAAARIREERAFWAAQTGGFFRVMQGPEVLKTLVTKHGAQTGGFFRAIERGLGNKTHPSRLARTLQIVGVVLLASGALGLNLGIGRPIWIDEFLHFCLAGYDSTAQAWKVTLQTVVGVNHGQTGVYMMLDYWLLKCFGANMLAFRLPSLLSALFLLLSAAAIMRFRGFGWFWQSLVILTVFAQDSWLMNFAAEARPYMPLAAATVGVLAYYLAPMDLRSRAWVAAIGWASVIWGTLMHPYFALYWLAVFAFCHVVALSENRFQFGVGSFIRHVNLPMSLTGMAIYFAIGRLTWLRGGPKFVFDPFYWIKQDRLWITVVSSHFEFLGSLKLESAFLWLVVALPFIYCLPFRSLRSKLLPLMAPAGLILLALSLTAITCYLSYRRDYWILGRQWIASIALVPIAFIWLWGEITRQLAGKRAWAAGMVIFFLSFVLLNPVKKAFATNWQSIENDIKRQTARIAQNEPGTNPAANSLTPDEWVELANQNFHQGGPVWGRFSHYYGAEYSGFSLPPP